MNYVHVVSIEFVLCVTCIGQSVIRYYSIFFFLPTKIYTLRNIYTLYVRVDRNLRTKRNDNNRRRKKYEKEVQIKDKEKKKRERNLRKTRRNDEDGRALDNVVWRDYCLGFAFLSDSADVIFWFFFSFFSSVDKEKEKKKSETFYFHENDTRKPLIDAPRKKRVTSRRRSSIVSYKSWRFFLRRIIAHNVAI